MQEFVTKFNDANAETIARILRTFIPPFVQRTARQCNARYSKVVTQPSREVAHIRPEPPAGARKRGRPKKEKAQ